MLSMLIYILILCLVAGVVFWILSMIPLPQPWLNVARAVVGIIILLVLIGWLLPMAPHPLLH